MLTTAIAIAFFGNSRADEPTASTWHCIQRHDSAFHAECSLQREDNLDRTHDPKSLAEQKPSAASPPYLPVAMRSRDEILAHRIWSVPMYNLPFNSSDAAFLLRAVLCGRAPMCVVHYSAGSTGLSVRSNNPSIP